LENSYNFQSTLSGDQIWFLSQVNLVTLTETSLKVPNYHSNCIFMRVSTFGKSYIGCNISYNGYIYMGVSKR